MTDHAGYDRMKDHDLLVALNTKTDDVKDDIKDMRLEQAKLHDRIDAVHSRVNGAHARINKISAAIWAIAGIGTIIGSILAAI
ncbi:MAG: hypothetical protein IIA59_00695 [Candidatus Marinimicrobia bacterium]|nr:hypothetical protein [Candidatus Neomarinimicrobiota bacterium]